MKYLGIYLIAASVVAVSAPARAEITLGVCIPFPSVDVQGQIRAFNRDAGKPHTLVLFFRPMSYSMAPDDLYLPLQVAAAGAVPVMGWETTDWSYAEIIAGRHDAYFEAMARAVRDGLNRVLISIDSEMNRQSDHPDSPDQFVLMWRHIHDIFDREKADNIEWVWAPNYNSVPRSTALHHSNFYPGDDYVDWVGTEGFNWKDRNLPAEIFDEILSEFLQMYRDKPAIIFYMGVAQDNPSDRARWIRDAYDLLPRYPNVKAAIWWNDVAYDMGFPADFRVVKTLYPVGGAAVPPTVTEAYRGATRPPLFLATLPPYPALLDWDPGDGIPLIDLTVDKTYPGTADEVTVTARVSPITTPFYPYVRILTPSGTIWYWIRDLGLRQRCLTYLPGGPYLLTDTLSDYPVLKVVYSGIEPGTYVFEGYSLDGAGRRIGPVDRETVFVH